MSDDSASTAWIDLSHCDDPRDAVHEAVACLAKGGVLGLATETSYGLTASALHPPAVGRLRELAGRPPHQSLTLLIKGSEEVSDWVPGLSPACRRLTRRLWPGPLVLSCPLPLSDGLLPRLPSEVQTLLAPNQVLELGTSSESFLRHIQELSPAPLILASLDAQEGPVTSSEALRQIDGLEMVIDTGPVRVAGGPTRIQVTATGWNVEATGAIDERTLSRMAGVIFLFVCTGNTCRSPMAEGICKLLLSRKLGCPIDRLEANGYLSLSAGVSAVNGAPAAPHAVNVLKSLGGALESHRSRQVTTELLRVADHVFAMTMDHLDALLDAVPEARSHAMLLDPEGGDVPDPIGADQLTYRQTADRIEQMLEHRLKELGL